MKEDQKYIYYACGKNIDNIDRLPQTELLKDRGYEILYLVDDVDEFALKMLHNYDGKSLNPFPAATWVWRPRRRKSRLRNRLRTTKSCSTS